MLACRANFGIVGQRAVAALTGLVKRPIFLCSFLINDPSLLETLCRQAYFTATPLSLGQATSMYGILYCLIKEFILLQSPLAQKHDLKAHASTCERNFTRGIETYQTLAMPCFENVLSLALGVGTYRRNTLTSQVTCSSHEPNLGHQSARRRKAIPVLYVPGRCRQPMPHARLLPRGDIRQAPRAQGRADPPCLLVHLHDGQEHVPSSGSPLVLAKF